MGTSLQVALFAGLVYESCMILVPRRAQPARRGYAHYGITLGINPEVSDQRL